MYRDGYYGFAEPLEFSSVVELVEFYRHNSLHPYSSKLDITLIQPVSKHEFGDGDSDSTGVKSDVVREREGGRGRGRERLIIKI